MKYKFLTGKDTLPEKRPLEKVGTTKKIEYSLFGSELRKQTDIAEKQYLRLGKVSEFDKNKGDETINEDDKKSTLKKYNESNLTYNNNHIFYINIKILKYLRTFL